jgi:hypothetical protein
MAHFLKKDRNRKVTIRKWKASTFLEKYIYFYYNFSSLKNTFENFKFFNSFLYIYLLTVNEEWYEISDKWTKADGGLIWVKGEGLMLGGSGIGRIVE